MSTQAGASKGDIKTSRGGLRRAPGLRARLSKRDLTLALAIATALGFGGTAGAHHVDSMFKTHLFDRNCKDGEILDEFCQTDNTQLTIWRQDTISSSGKTRIRDLLTDRFDPTTST